MSTYIPVSGKIFSGLAAGAIEFVSDVTALNPGPKQHRSRFDGLSSEPRLVRARGFVYCIGCAFGQAALWGTT